jgi:hypothetical protein
LAYINILEKTPIGTDSKLIYDKGNDQISLTEYTSTPTPLLTSALIDDGGWHFFKWSYTHATNTSRTSIDNGSDTVLVDLSPESFFSALMAISKGNTTSASLFDFRVFSTVLTNAQLAYYYRDVLAGGNRVLPIG